MRLKNRISYWWILATFVVGVLISNTVGFLENRIGIEELTGYQDRITELVLIAIILQAIYITIVNPLRTNRIRKMLKKYAGKVGVEKEATQLKSEYDANQELGKIRREPSELKYIKGLKVSSELIPSKKRDAKLFIQEKGLSIEISNTAKVKVRAILPFDKISKVTLDVIEEYTSKEDDESKTLMDLLIKIETVYGECIQLIREKKDREGYEITNNLLDFYVSKQYEPPKEFKYEKIDFETELE